MNRKLTFAVVLLLLTSGLSSAAAYADTFTITLNNPQAGYFGDGLGYIAAVFAPASSCLLGIEVVLAFFVLKKLHRKLISVENYFIGRPECD
ncbi:hypothetical protein [Granulicella sp. dw_53]|uniref:hypothetical protein n=1 Tax=Granulicella sp. dw_53 TaxID=2719792 RepID=UPI001BD25AB6|nr:hypothetical protein [Granulicella sp. dw_53]